MDTYRRIFLIIYTAFAIAVGCFGVVIYRNTGNAMREQLASKCVGIASAVAVLIERDTDGYREFCRTLDTESDYYTDIIGDLRRILTVNRDSIAYLYTEIKISETEMMYILDASVGDDGDHFAPPGEVDYLTVSEKNAYVTQQPYYADEFDQSDYFGSLLTCYAPIFDRASGEFLGLVGTDVSIDQYQKVMRSQLVIVLASVSVLLLAVAFTFFLSSGSVVRMITTDGLTGAFNKSYFMRAMRRQMRASAGKQASLTVFMADLDHFKRVNDKYGHPFGDVVLAAVAREISTTLRKTDCLARYGGEEFAAYLPDASRATATRALERIRLAVSNMKIHNEEFNEDVPITISIGATQAAPGQTVAEVIEMADKALYFAKKTRNTVAFHTLH